jgi:hypothetical protein
MSTDFLIDRPLLMRQASKEIQDFWEYLHWSKGSIGPDCAFFSKLCFSELISRTPGLPPEMVFLGRNSVTARGFDFDFNTDPNETVVTQSGEIEKVVADHFHEAIVEKRHLCVSISTYTTRAGITRTLRYEKLTTPVSLGEAMFNATYLVQRPI